MAAEARRPGRQANRRAARELPCAATLRVDHPELAHAAPVGDEHEMPAVRRPGWILVPAIARELPQTAVAEIDREQLEHRADARLEGDEPAIRRPVRARAVRALSDVERRHEIH